jgi:DNA/RNA-binding domain of Phe-tRNA-synthetase-like protein
MFTQSEIWNEIYPGAAVGVLAMDNVVNPKESASLNEQKEVLEAGLRERFSGCDRAALRALPSIQPYHAYYKRFKKTYHVLHQLESVALKGKPIPRAAALVEAMFMAELKNQLLTAGHDLAVIRMPVGVDVAAGGERYTGISGREQTTKQGDMMIADAEGIISSIIYGPDRRTCITAKTGQALFTTYAPEGIESEAVQTHLDDIESYVRLVAPEAEVMLKKVFGKGENR